MGLLREMSQLRLLPDVISFNAGISACEKVAQGELALSLLREMPQLTLLPDEFSSSAGINS